MKKSKIKSKSMSKNVAKLLCGYMAAVFACGVTALLAGSAQDNPTSSLMLLGPEVTKLDWNTRGLNAADVDKDGLEDIVLINNDYARGPPLLAV